MCKSDDPETSLFVSDVQREGGRRSSRREEEKGDKTREETRRDMTHKPNKNITYAPSSPWIGYLGGASQGRAGPWQRLTS